MNELINPVEIVDKSKQNNVSVKVQEELIDIGINIPFSDAEIIANIILEKGASMESVRAIVSFVHNDLSIDLDISMPKLMSQVMSKLVQLNSWMSDL